MSDLFLKVDQLGVGGTILSKDGRQWTIRVEREDPGWTGEAISRMIGESMPADVTGIDGIPTRGGRR